MKHATRGFFIKTGAKYRPRDIFACESYMGAREFVLENQVESRPPAAAAAHRPQLILSLEPGKVPTGRE